MRTSFRLSKDAIDALGSLRDGLRLANGRVVELALQRLEAQWRKGGLKVPDFPRKKTELAGLFMTNEGVAILDRLAPGLDLSRTHVVELALKRCGDEWRAGKIEGIGFLVSGRV